MTVPEPVTPAEEIEPAALVVVDPAPAGPVPTLAGTFAIYDDTRGGFVLVTDIDGVQQRKHVPAAIVKLASGAGPLGHLFRKIGPVRD